MISVPCSHGHWLLPQDTQPGDSTQHSLIQNVNVQASGQPAGCLIGGGSLGDGRGSPGRKGSQTAPSKWLRLNAPSVQHLATGMGRRTEMMKRGNILRGNG